LRQQQAVADAERAVALNPNYAGGYDILGTALIFDGKLQEAMPNIEKAIRLDPKSETYYRSNIGLVDLLMGRYPEAAQMFERALASYPNSLTSHLLLCIAYSELGRQQGAREQAAEVMRLNPQFHFIPQEKLFPNSPLAGYFDADLRKAGLKSCTSNSLAPQAGYPGCGS
jgi:adenylate cyclase